MSAAERASLRRANAMAAVLRASGLTVTIRTGASAAPGGAAANRDRIDIAIR